MSTLFVEVSKGHYISLMTVANVCVRENSIDVHTHNHIYTLKDEFADFFMKVFKDISRSVSVDKPEHLQHVKQFVNWLSVDQENFEEIKEIAEKNSQALLDINKQLAESIREEAERQTLKAFDKAFECKEKISEIKNIERSNPFLKDYHW